MSAFQCASNRAVLAASRLLARARLNRVFGSDNSPVAHVLNETDMVFSGRVTAQSLNVATDLTVGGGLVAANVTANTSVFANSFYVTNGYPHPIPSGSLFASVQNAVIANTPELTATSLIASNNRSYIAALQTLTTTQGTSLTSLQTAQTPQASMITTLQSTQSSQGATLSTLQTQTASNTTAITSLQSTVTALSTSSS